ncbi:MAG: HAD-IA family hydrolase [Acidimicrobiia bacterium]
MTAPGYDIVLFDLGGVLVDFGGVEPMKALSGVTSDEEIWRRWLACEPVRIYERGECSDVEFAAGVVADWDLPISPAEFLESFRGWIGGPLPGAQQLITETRAVVTVGCLSNTNALHNDAHFQQWSEVAGLEHQLFSYELGAVKPDREIFDRAVDLLGVAPDRIVFLDDNQINVDGALASGLVARRARGVAEARAALVALGVLDG